jgi:uncharacterized surface protein with fasciclin (FAS1) repeats
VYKYTRIGGFLLVVMMLALATSIALGQETTPTAEPMMVSEDCPPLASVGEMDMTEEAEATETMTMEEATMMAGEMFTVGEDGTIIVNEFPAEIETLLPGVSLVTFVNMLEGDTPVTFYRDDVAFATSLLSGGANQVTIPVDSGTYGFSVYDDNSPDAPFDEETEIDLIDSYYYIITAMDGDGGPELRIQEVTRAEYALANGQLAEPGTVVDALNSYGLCYLADAIESAGLTETLNGEGPFTLFVPADFLSNEVASLGGDMETLLLNHVVEGDFKSFDLTSLEESLTTLAGNPLDIQVVENVITVNGYQVLQVNIPAINGTIHVIDGILTPGNAG